MSTKIILIRHGETEWSRRKRYCSFTDVGLNKKGKEQARKLYKKLKKEKIHALYTSDAKRAVQFAKIVFKGMAIEKCVGFREMDFGSFEGLTYQEIMTECPRLYQKWLENPFNTAIPGGESLNKLAKRVSKTLEGILRRNNDRTVAIVTHAGPIKVILCDVLKLGLKGIWAIKPGLASVNVLELTNG